MDPGFDRQHGRPCSATEPSYGPETFNLAHGWYVLDDCRDEHVMHRLHRYGKTAIDDARRASGRARVVGLAVAIALAAAVGLSIMPTARSARPNPPPIAAAPPPAAVDPSRFILNALLAPALDADAVPLLWVDPRPTLGCGPNATVRVNGEPLLAGALVPVAPFELEWQTDDCHPYGARGPRFDGQVRLTVFREDWGFSAMVEPSDLRVAFAENETGAIHPGAASMPQCVESDETYELTIGADRSLACR